MSNTNTKTISFGTKVGTAIGKSAAYAVHGAVLAAQSTGRFGQDVVAGSREGYTTMSEELAARREELRAQRLPGQTKVAVKVSKKAVAA